MIKVLFICHGNICRSPMAEYIFNDMVQQLGSADRLSADSCAVSREEIGNPVYPPARAELEAHGVKCGAHRARQLTREDYDRCDMLVCMDESNVSRALRLLVCKGKQTALFIVRHTCRQRPLLFLRLLHLADHARSDHALIAIGIRAAGLSGCERVRAVQLKADARRSADELCLAALVRDVEIKPVR